MNAGIYSIGGTRSSSSGGAALTPATTIALGGVIVSTGLNVAGDGSLSVAYGTTSGVACVGNDARLVSDGSKGDITVSASNGTWSINAGAVVENDIADSAVTYSKIQNVTATNKILGRSSAGAGVVQEIDCTAAGRSLIAGANAAAQRSTLGLDVVANLPRRVRVASNIHNWSNFR